MKDSGYRCHKRSENSGEYGGSLETNTLYVDDKALPRGDAFASRQIHARQAMGVSRTEAHTRPNRKGRISAAVLVEQSGWGGHPLGRKLLRVEAPVAQQF